MSVSRQSGRSYPATLRGRTSSPSIRTTYTARRSASPVGDPPTNPVDPDRFSRKVKQLLAVFTGPHVLGSGTRVCQTLLALSRLTLTERETQETLLAIREFYPRLIREIDAQIATELARKDQEIADRDAQIADLQAELDEVDDDASTEPGEPEPLLKSLSLPHEKVDNSYTSLSNHQCIPNRQQTTASRPAPPTAPFKSRRILKSDEPALYRAVALSYNAALVPYDSLLAFAAAQASRGAEAYSLGTDVASDTHTLLLVQSQKTRARCAGARSFSVNDVEPTAYLLDARVLCDAKRYITGLTNVKHYAAPSTGQVEADAVSV